ncbi:MAG: TIGR03067 domain-containing protein [Gemmataceae bacterium]
MQLARVMLLVVLAGFAVVFAGTATSASPVPKHLQKEGDSEQAKFQGKWKVHSIKVGGMEIGATGIDMHLEFRGDTFTAIANDQTTTAKVKFDVVDGVKRMTTTESQTISRDGNPIRTSRDESVGYTLDGDKLTVATTQDQKPIDPVKADKDAIVMVLIRVKDEK